MAYNIMSLTSVTLEVSPPLTLHYCEYENASMLFIQHLKKLGTFIHASVDNPEDPPEQHIYSVQTKFGEREEWIEALARAVIQQLGLRKPMFIIAALTSKNKEVFDSIVQNLHKVKQAS
mmetsp:Transcript_15166/g.22054  ORF Transcript_15166/g.22054 Transcript_15166/m.22054 type:complete len:119 (+) Transcript_15166:1054-1410(+)